MPNDSINSSPQDKSLESGNSDDVLPMAPPAPPKPSRTESRTKSEPKKSPKNPLDFSQITAGKILDTRFGITVSWIPPGQYKMGSPTNELGHRSNENQVSVIITKGYWIARTTCTQKQWQDIMGYNPSTFKGLDLPVQQVNWEDAKLFCERLTEEGRRNGDLTEAMSWDLPSEAQWEYACRADSTMSLNNGEPLSCEDGNCTYLEKVAWYSANSGGMPHPVARLQPNKWGLYDMHGNVWEWCRDWYNDFNLGGEDPCNLVISKYRSIRGGGWGDAPWACRSAARHQNPLPRDSDFGFRPIICIAE